MNTDEIRLALSECSLEEVIRSVIAAAIYGAAKTGPDDEVQLQTLIDLVMEFLKGPWMAPGKSQRGGV